MKRMSLFGVKVALISCIAFAAGCSSDPEPEPEPQPVVVVVEESAPPPKEPGWDNADPGTVAIRREKNPLKRVVFLNDFGWGPASAIEDALDADPEFVDVFSDPTKPSRVAIEFTYYGDNVMRSLKRVIKSSVGFPFTFREAYLPKHVEIYRVK